VDARMREFVGKEALKEIESSMPKDGGSDCDVLLMRVMLSSERDGGRICILGLKRRHSHSQSHSHNGGYRAGAV